MPRFEDLPDDFVCPYRHGCPYLEGLSTAWVFARYQRVVGTECHYEYQLEELHKELDQERRQRKQAELEREQLKAQLHALHRRQFKGRTAAPAPSSECASAQRKKRGPPFAIFVDGCFWHGCRWHCRMPQDNRQYWQAKISRNHARDQATSKALRASGWGVLRVWSHSLRQPDAVLKRIISRLNTAAKRYNNTANKKCAH